MGKKKIIVVGGGPAGLMAAEQLGRTHQVSLYEKEDRLGRKLVLAGKGGFNLTNSLQGDALVARYAPAGFMDKALDSFDTHAFRAWLMELGVPTYTGTSGRVFPAKEITPAAVLDRIKNRLKAQGVQVFLKHKFVDFGDHGLITFEYGNKRITEEADFIIFALGGASWPSTGSDGMWVNAFESKGIVCRPFQSSNCGVNIGWPEAIKNSHTGKPLKNIRVSAGDLEVSGEAVITEYGLEGNAIYPLVPVLREMLNAGLPAIVCIDLKPLNSISQLLQKAEGKPVDSKHYGSLFHLHTAQMALIKAYTGKEKFLEVNQFVHCLKKLVIPVISLRPVEEAISTIGGISTVEVNENFSLKKYPWIFTIGEMVDWDAPTGGFLIQGCCSMANYVAQAIG